MKITPEIKRTLEEMPARSGCYQWIFAHQGDIIQYSDDFEPENYDIVQVNGAPIDFPIVYKVRKKIGKNSSTKLVVNNDYVSEAWEKRNIMPALWEQVFEQGDMIFGTEPAQTSMLGDRAFCIPHPTNTRQLKHFRVPEKTIKQNKPVVSSVFHWWVGNVWNSYNATKELPIYSQLIAYVKENDRFPLTKQMFDELVGPMAYEAYAETLLGSKAVLDLCPYHTYGRTTVDLACFEMPHIVSDRIYSGKLLWGDMAIDPYDIRAARNVLQDILNNKEWIQETIDSAYDKVEYFNHKNSLERYYRALELVEEGKESYGWLWNEEEKDFIDARRGY